MGVGREEAGREQVTRGRGMNCMNAALQGWVSLAEVHACVLACLCGCVALEHEGRMRLAHSVARLAGASCALRRASRAGAIITPRPSLVASAPSCYDVDGSTAAAAAAARHCLHARTVVDAAMLYGGEAGIEPHGPLCPNCYSWQMRREP